MSTDDENINTLNEKWKTLLSDPEFVQLMRNIELDQAKAMGVPHDWRLFDFPWMLPDMFDKLVGIVGPDNLTIVSGSQMQQKDGSVLCRATVFISPDGIAQAIKAKSVLNLEDNVST